MQLTQALAAFLIGETRKCRKLCSSSQSGKSCSTSRKELKNCVSEAPSPRGAAPNRVPLLRRVSAFENSSWQRTNLRSSNIDMPLIEKYLAQLSRRPPPPCEAPAYSWQQPCAVRTHDCTSPTQGNMQERKAFSSKNLTGRPEKAHPWKRIAAIQNRLDRIGWAGAILTRSIRTRTRAFDAKIHEDCYGNGNRLS